MNHRRFTVRNIEGRWCVFDTISRKYYRGYRTWADAAGACDKFNDDNEMAGQAKAALL